MPPTTRRKRGSVGPRPGKKLLAHDRSLGIRYVAGADEAGRGCLAGPLVAAAVVLDIDSMVGPDAAVFGHLNDSKKVAPPMRDRLYDAVLAHAAAWSVVSFSPATIDRVGLHKTNLAALRTAFDQLSVPYGIELVDGFDLGYRRVESRRMIKGDATSASIAAASIIAKVTRDRLMHRLDMLDPRWNFTEHVGYATPEHHERIRVHGITRYHRLSFASSAYETAGTGTPPATDS